MISFFLPYLFRSLCFLLLILLPLLFMHLTELRSSLILPLSLLIPAPVSVPFSLPHFLPSSHFTCIPYFTTILLLFLLFLTSPFLFSFLPPFHPSFHPHLSSSPLILTLTLLYLTLPYLTLPYLALPYPYLTLPYLPFYYSGRISAPPL